MNDADPGPGNDLCVIGGGWAGIAAAVEACSRGLRVVLIEAAPQLGGRARTIEVDLGFGPVRLDNGQHLLMGAYRETLELIERISPAAGTIFTRHRLELRDSAGLSLRAATLPAPWHLALGLLQARGLGIAGRLGCARLLLHLMRYGWRVPQGETVAQLLQRTAQSDWLIGRLWRPLCVSALNTPDAQACARTFATVLRDTLGADAGACDFLLPTGTLGDCLPGPAEHWLRSRGSAIRLRSPARRIERGDDCWMIDLGGSTVTARAVVLALPPAGSERLMRSSPHCRSATDWPALSASLQGFRPMPIATTYLAWPATQGVSLARWVMLAHGARRFGATAGMPVSGPGDWVFDRGVQRSHRIAAIVASALDDSRHTPVASLQTALIGTATATLGLPVPTHAFTVVERRATFACVPERPEIRQPAIGVLPMLWLAGDYTESGYPATLESAVRSGRRAGTLAAAALAPRPAG